MRVTDRFFVESQMARGLFPRFVRAIRSAWRTSLPEIEDVHQTFSPLMPKASTFHVALSDVAPGVAPYLFLVFQHHSKPWAAGRFTINLAAAATFGAPGRDNRKPSLFQRGEEGFYRIGGVLRRKDTWWSLAPEKLDDNGPLTPRPVRLRLSTGETDVQMTSSTLAFIVWRPSSYSDEATVFSEAIDDVTAAVRAAIVEATARRAVS
jgi:hypothetical protein